MKETGKSIYVKPVLTKLENLRDTTFECPDFQCSIPVPPSP